MNCRFVSDCTGACASAVASPVPGSVPRVFSYISRTLVLHFDQTLGTVEDLKAARRHLDVLIELREKPHG